MISLGEKASNGLAEVISVDQVSEAIGDAVERSSHGPDRAELAREDWVELEIAPAGYLLTDKDLPFLVIPPCEIDAGDRVELSEDLLLTNLVFEDSESDEPEEIVRAVYLATGIEKGEGNIWTVSGP